MAGNPRDVNINIVGHDHTKAAALEAERNLNKVKRAAKDVGDSNSAMEKVAKRSMSSMADSFKETATLMRSAGPYAAVAAIGAGIAALPTIAAVAGVGIVGGLGGGLLAIGVKFAAMNKEVRSAWSKTKDHVVARLKEMAQPFEPVLIRIAQRASKTFDSFSPALADAFKKMAPALDAFSVQFFSAFERLKPAIKPLTQAFTDLLRDIGPKLPGLFSSIATQVANVARAISKNPQAVKSLVTGLQNVVTVTGTVIAYLIRANASVTGWLHTFKAAGQDIQIALQAVATKVYGMVADIVNAMSKLPGPLGAPFRSMKKAVDDNVARAQAKLNSLKTDRARTQVQILKDRMRVLGNQKFTPKVAAETRSAEIAIANIQAKLRGIKDEYVKVFVSEVRRDTATAKRGPSGFSSGPSWEASGGGRYRTQAPQPVNVTSGPVTVDTRVLLDSSVIRSQARTVVVDNERRAAWRARTGRR